MLADLFEVKLVGSKGRGLIAKQDIPCGTILNITCDKCLAFADEDEGEQDEHVQTYSWRDEHKIHHFDCGDAIYTNHSCSPNGHFLGTTEIAIRDIAKGEEYVLDYRYFHCNPEHGFPCACGNSNCCGHMRYASIATPELHAEWQTLLTNALKYVSKVPQPLVEFVRMGDPNLGSVLKPRATHRARVLQNSIVGVDRKKKASRL